MRRLAVVATLLLLLVSCGEGDEGGIGASPSPEPAVTEPGGTPTGGPTVESASPHAEATPTLSPSPSAAPTADRQTPTLSSEAWTTVGRGPRGFTEIAAAELGGKLFTVGGLNAGFRGIDTVMVYDPVFDIWGEGPPLPELLHHTAVVSTGAELLQIAGYRGQGFSDPIAAVHRLDPATGAWEEYAPLPERRGAGAAAWDGTRVVYAGGVGPDGLAGDVYALDLEAGEWTRIGELEHPREHLAAASDGRGRVWFLGGRLGGMGSNVAAVERVRGDTVEVVGELPTARGGVSGFYHPSAGACAVGGEDPERTFSEVECVDENGEVTVLPSLQTPRHGLGVAVVDGVAYAAYGGHQPGLTFSAVVEALLLD